MNIVIDLLLAVYVVVSLLLVLVVLMQRPRSEGLGTAFASGMVEQYIGPATNVLVRFTTWMGGAFFILSVLLAILYSHRSTTRSKIGERLRSVPALKASATPKPAAAASPAPSVAGPQIPLVVPVIPPLAAPPAVAGSPGVTVPESAASPSPAAAAEAGPSPSDTPAGVAPAAASPNDTPAAASPSAAPATPAATRRKKH